MRNEAGVALMKLPEFETFKYRINSMMKPYFHTHASSEIYYFHSGKCQYLLGGELIDLVPGDLIIMNGIREHGPVIDEQFEYIRSTILFDGASFGTLKLQPGFVDVLRPFLVSTYYHWRLNGEYKTEIEQLLFRINRFYQSGNPVASQRLGVAFYDLLLFIYERFMETSDSGKSLPNEKEKLVQNVMAYIEQHYMDELTLDELAREMHVSRFYLMKLFKQLTGMTLFDYINEHRIKQAKVLFFLDNGRSVTDVCFQIGFKHLSHFSRTFKKIAGMTPDQYRKLL